MTVEYDDTSYCCTDENGYKYGRYPLNWKQLEEKLNAGIVVRRLVYYIFN